MTDTLDLTSTYVIVDGSSATALEGGDAFWRLLMEDDPAVAAVHRGWLVSTYKVSESWTNWEMHPNGDEIVQVLSGACDLVLDLEGGPQVVKMDVGHAIIVPRGVWHTAKLHQPSEILHITFGEGTLFRPVG